MKMMKEKVKRFLRFFGSNPRYWLAIVIGFLGLTIGVVIDRIDGRGFWGELIINLSSGFVLFGLWFGLWYAYVDLKKQAPKQAPRPTGRMK